MRWLLLFALAVPAPAAATDAIAPPAQLGLCAACHREDGRAGEPGTPRLAGQDASYLRAALASYRNGQRSHAPMIAVSGALSERDIAELAAWYAAQPACAPP